MKKITAAFLFLFLFISPCFANRYLDSLYRAYHSAKVDTVRFNIIFEILDQRLNEAFENYNPDSAIGLIEQHLPEVRAKNNPELLSDFLIYQGSYYSRKKKYELSNQYLDSSLQLLEPLHAYERMGNVYFLKSANYKSLNLTARAVESKYKEIECYEKTGSKQYISFAVFYLANLYSANQQYSRAEEFYLKSAMIAEDWDSIGRGMSYVFCARMALYQNNLNKAGTYLEKARPVLSSTIAFQPYYYYLVYGQWLKRTGKRDEAVQYFIKAADQSVKGNQRYQRPNALCEIAEIYIAEKKLGDAKKILDEAAIIAGEEKNDNVKITVHTMLSKYYESLKIYSKAFEEFKTAQALKDSLKQNELSQSLTSSALEYDYGKKETARAEEQRKKDEAEAQKLREQKVIAYSTGGVLVFVGFISLLLYRNNRQQKRANIIITSEKKRSDELLLNILPSEVAEELKAKGSADAKLFDDVTVMFTDFKNFTQISEKLSPAELVAEIHTCFKAFDNIIGKRNIEKIKTIGDAYMCAGGLPVANTTNATDVVNAAMEIQQFMKHHSQQRKTEDKEPFEIRIGIHTGPVVAGIVGVKKFAYDIWGDTVNIASRMESSGEAGKVNISGSTYELVKDKFKCEYRGKIQAKNKGEIDMYFVESNS